MARVLLLHPPLLLHRAFIDYPYLAGLGTWQSAANLRAAGHDVTVLDAFCLPTSTLSDERGGMIRLGVPWATYLGRLPEQAPDVVVIAASPWLRARAASAEVARFVSTLAERWPNARTILADLDVGGQHVIAWDESWLDELGVECGLRFEADQSLPQLCAALASGAVPEARLLDGRPPEALGTLPPPAYDLVDMAAFQTFLGRVARADVKREIFDLHPPLAAIKTSRGCAYSCSFCTATPWRRAGVEGQGWRPIPIEQVRENLQQLRDEHGIRRVVVLDELVNVKASHFDGLLDALIALEMRADFPNGMRADRLTEAQVQRLATVSPLLSISAEAATERVANEIIGKRFDREATHRVAQWCQAAGLPLVVHWMIGSPGERRDEIVATLETAWALFEAHGARPLVQFATPIAGTPLFDEVERRGLWTQREDRDIGPLFQGQAVIEDREAGWTAHELEVAKRVLEVKVETFVPRKVIMNTTYICNNQCVFCATGNRLPTHGEVAEQIGFMTERRKQGFDLIDFDGGEPTTNPNLFLLLRKAKELGYQQINLTSNGRMLMLEKNAAKVVRSGITNLLISLHGPNPEVHEKQVQSKGAFEQTTAGIANAVELCREQGVGFGVNVTLTKTNFPVLMEYGDLLVRLGVEHCNIQFVTPFGRASAETQPDPAEVAPVVMQLIDRFGDRIQFQVINLPICYMPGYESYCMGDLYKLERRMVFVTMDDVNLFDYLQARRRHETACETCFFKLGCEGFYYFPDEWKDEARARWGD
ncbi:MAG: radical SAM protein [Deltaproteobacteria bacterium]|nr:radical SAM protein [Deltaproteobacteria bacterium]